MAKDKDILVLNPTTGNLDLVRKFNPNRIISHLYSPFGNPLMFFDPTINVYYEAGPQLVFDNEGNVVTI